MNETNGVVIKVVTSVISTKITNTEGVNIPISYPIVNTTSSINPRVFMSAPMYRLSFQLSPTNRAENIAPPNFPAMATTMKIRHSHHNSGLFRRPISVRNPVDTKNKGRNRARDTSSTFSVMILRNLMFPGMTTPAIKAPKRACNPNISVK